MKHKTWFKLVLQAIGVLLVGLAIPTFIGEIGTYIRMHAMMNQGAGIWGIPVWQQLFWSGIGPGIQVLLGIYLMTGAKWLLNRFIPSNRPYCPECGYDVTHNRSPKCPECGVALSGRAEEGAEAAT